MLTSGDFATFYEAIHSKPGERRRPFRWQLRLADQVCREGWGEQAIALPTACGKTSVIDIAVFALALQAQQAQGRRSAPLRTFFVVDRRLVVDDASGHATKLADALESAEERVVREVADALLTFGGAKPLETAILRGGMYRSNCWVDLPNQPLVCVSTVDQVGSRLLFRGYGCSEERRPVDAGLVGCDSLILLDEAHLSQPFLHTLRQARHFAGWGEHEVARPVKIVEMSATSRSKERFGLVEEDFEDAALATRLNAVKWAELRETTDLKTDAVATARTFAKSEQVRVIGIVVNTVAMARAIHGALGAEAILLTGRIRPYDRDKLLEKYLKLMRPGRARDEGERLFVVATQTVEVGADLDFDALISEAAPLDALRQRFGRLDRLGTIGATRAAILRQKYKGFKDWVYGDSSQVAWDWLNRHGTAESGPMGIDFGVWKMQALFAANPEPEANSTAGTGPLLFPAILETWVQTNPTPWPDPDVAPFLHGMDAKPGDLNIVWRADLAGDPSEWAEMLEKAPPLMREALPVPFHTTLRWLKGDTGGAVSDVEGTSAGDENEKEALPRQFLIWRGVDKPYDQRARFFPGDTLVVRSQEGGADCFGWNPTSRELVPDIGDLCANERASQRSGRYRLRVHPEVIFGDEPNSRRALEGFIRGLMNDEIEKDDPELWSLIRTKVAEEVVERVMSAKPQWYSDGSGYVLTSAWQTAVKPKRDMEPEDEDSDDTSSLTVVRTLRQHTDGVTEKASRYAVSCGLGKTLQECLALAAQMHDLGKCDERFQMLLDPTRGPQAEPVAKGEFGDYQRRMKLSGYPRGGRHEFWSVRLIEKSQALAAAPDRELVKYLVGVHHGKGRPFAPVWTEDGTTVTALLGEETLTADDVGKLWTIGSGWTDLFWKMVGRYGFWGLAYLEAILRRADCVQSREEQQ